MKVASYWLLATAVYFCAAFYLLWDFAGPSPGDGYGSGYTPGLSLPGIKPPSVSFREYRDSSNVRFQYRVPYYVVAFVFALLGGVAPSRILRRYPKLGRHPFAASTVIGLVLLLVGPAVLDAGSRLHFWQGPTWFTWDVWMVHVMIKLFLPLTLLSGLVGVGARLFGIK